jgi:hypothetical protein
MSYTSILLSIAAVALALLALLVTRSSRRQPRHPVQRPTANDREADWMPPQLLQAKLLFVEPQNMHMDSPRGITARVDRAYQHVDQSISLVELKQRARHRIYSTDRIELSVQALVVEANGHGKVRPTAYVVTENRETGARHLHHVQLLPREQIIEMHDRYGALINGRASPGHAASPQACHKCSFARKCPQRVRPAPRPSQRRREH